MSASIPKSGHGLELAERGALKPKVIAIIGAGHSGSTVLDVVLGGHAAIQGVGELHKLARSGWTRNDDRRCACGAPIHACPFWTAVRRHWMDATGLPDAVPAYVRLQSRFERSRASWPRVVFRTHRPSAEYKLYEDMTAKLYEAICHVAGTRTVVDSSKSPLRGYALLRNDRLDVRLVHLVRDGRAVVWSKLKPRIRDVEGGIPSDRRSVPVWQTALSWAVANVESDWVLKQLPTERTLRLTYERLVENPAGALVDLAGPVDEDLGRLGRDLSAGRPVRPVHTVGGNQLRMQPLVAIQPNVEWTAKLGRRDRDTFWRLSGWVARRYGYER